MAITQAILKAPFPAFGGKSRIADTVWRRMGNPRNYIEPFAFSAAVLLRRPEPGAIETINDLNAYVSNFWRAVKADPEAVAHHADWPVNETDLHPRHRWLVQSEAANTELQRVRDEPDHYDAKIAGWWCWGACMWIGSGWCEYPEWEGRGTALQRPRHLSQQIPVIGDTYGKGVNASCVTHRNRPVISADKPEFGRGVHADHRPQLADAYARGRGVHGNDAAGTCEQRRVWLAEWMHRLADRLRTVRVCCGHWDRVCDSESTLTRLGATGVFLDPPYRHSLADGTTNRAKHLYVNDKTQDVNALCDEVQAWCLKWGDNPEIKIALCGLEGEYPALEAAGWECFAWKSGGGYGNRTARGKENAARERIWFNKACEPAKKDESLFAEVA